jgi:predicted DNA-binding transcriptional regulator AlpA
MPFGALKMTETAVQIGRVLTFKELKERGFVPWTQANLYALERKGLFPPRIKLSGTAGRVCWLESEIEQWLRDRIEARNTEAAQKRRRIWQPNLGRLTPRENTA